MAADCRGPGEDAVRVWGNESPRPKTFEAVLKPANLKVFRLDCADAELESAACRIKLRVSELVSVFFWSSSFITGFRVSDFPDPGAVRTLKSEDF